MIVFTKKDLEERVKIRPFGYRNAIMEVAKLHESGKYIISFEDSQRLREKYKDKTNILFKLRSFIDHLKKNFLIFLKTKKLLSSKKVTDFRYSICESCPYFTKLKTCQVCGCFLPSKTKLIYAKCPLGKWD